MNAMGSPPPGVPCGAARPLVCVRKLPDLDLSRGESHVSRPTTNADPASRDRLAPSGRLGPDDGRSRRLSGDIAIVGGGLAGSMAATMLARSGYDVILIDPHDVPPRDFRCEKLEQGHVELLRRTGLADAVLRASTCTETLWVARFGRLVDIMPFKQYGMAYGSLVDTVRSQIPPGVRRSRAWADSIKPSADRQLIHLSDGSSVDVRLAVLASGGNWRLLAALGVKRTLASPCHSITVGFDIRRIDGQSFPFPALQYNPERVVNDVAYLTLFQMNGVMRANLFLYLPLKSSKVAAFRDDPVAALRALLPGLARVTGQFAIDGPVKVRPTDLHELRDYDIPGVVMIGDAFLTPCPATGTGALKLFMDVDRLCSVYIPRWMQSDGMPVAKLRAFYADAEKAGCDRRSTAHAYRLRAVSTDPSLRGKAGREMRYYFRLLRWGLRRVKAARWHGREVARTPGSASRAVGSDGAAL